jgi:hypothetical protein
MSTSTTFKNFDNNIQAIMRSKIPDESSMEKVEECVRQFCPQWQNVFRRLFIDAQEWDKLDKALALVKEELEIRGNHDTTGLGQFLPSVYAHLGISPPWKREQ